MVDAILEAAARVFRELGYARASTNRIAQVAGVSVGSLYQYFDDKAAIARALVERVEAEVFARMTRVALDDADLPTTVTGLINAVVAAHERDPELVRMMISTLGLEHESDGLPEITTLVRQLLERHRKQISAPDLDVAAWVLVHAVDALLSRNEVGPQLSRRKLRDECVRMVLGYLQGPAQVGRRRAGATIRA